MSSHTITYISWLQKMYFGGVERRAHEFANLAAEVYPTTLLSASFPFQRYQRSAAFDTDPIFIPWYPYWFGQKARLERYFLYRSQQYVKRHASDIKVVHGTGFHAVAGTRNNIPTVTVWQGRVPQRLQGTGRVNRLYQEAAHDSNYVIAISEQMRHQFIDNGVDQEKVVVVYNGVNVDWIQRIDATQHAAIKQKYGISPEQTVLLTVQHLIEKKRVTKLLELLKDIVAVYPDCHLLVCGDGPKRREAEQYALHHNLPVTFTGQVEDELPYLYNTADIFLLNSVREGLPLVYTEAMAGGCALVASNAGSTAELIQHGKNGFVSEEYDDAQFAHNLVSLLQNPALVQQMKETNRIESVAFSWRRQFEKIQSLYERLLV